MRALVALALTLALTACSVEEITIATVDTDAGGGKICKGNDDCAPNELCAKASCTDITGGCELRPLLCDATPAPSCGCSGVTYWNDCLRKQEGEAFGGAGECVVNAAKCQLASDCPSGASCARLVPDHVPCPPNMQGYCWWLPDTCPATQPTMQQWAECGVLGVCHDTCAAIRDGHPHHAEHGPICP